MALQATSTSPIRLSLQNPKSISYGQLQASVITVNCSFWSRTAYYFRERCPDSTEVNITCRAREKGQYQIRCPGVKSLPVCARWDSSEQEYVADSQCTLVSYSADTVVCDCRMDTASSAGSRRLQTGPLQSQYSTISKLVREALDVTYQPGIPIDYAEDTVVVTSTVLSFGSLLLMGLLTCWFFK
eukprot:gene24456-30243_t